MIPLSVLLVTGFAGFAAVIYFVYVYNQNYWKRKGIPSPPSNDLFGNHLDEISQLDYPFSQLIRDWTKQYGPVYGIMEGWMKTWVISDPTMAHEMFVKKFEFFHSRRFDPLLGNIDTTEKLSMFSSRGTRWKRLRTISSPNFSLGNLKKIYPTVNDSCQKIVSFLDKAFEEGKPFNIHLYFYELMMDIIMRIAMGQKGSKLFNNPYVRIATDIRLTSKTPLMKKLAMVFPPLAGFFRQLHLLQNYMANSPENAMLAELVTAIREKKKLKASGQAQTDAEHVDFIDLFMDAEDSTVKDGDFQKSGMKISKKMTESEVILSCYLFLLAGFDTTANTLAATCHFLTKYPEVQERVFEEIQDVVMDEEITFEKVNELKYMDFVMKETLRMYPIGVLSTSRLCMHTTTLGDYKIKAGENVNVDVLTLHYNKEIWGENADEFVPERFMNFTTEQQMVYFSFGGGPRTCIGMRLAYLEEKLALYHILKKYKLVRAPEITGFAGFAAVIYFIYVYNRSYWKRKGIPSPPSDDFFGNHLSKVSQIEYPINYILRDWTKKYGPVYGIMEGWMKTWVISDPKMAHEMFVKKFEYFHGRKTNPMLGNVDTNKRCHVFNARGARWKRLRTISSPSFSLSNLKKIYPTVDDSCLKLMDFVDKAYEEGKPFNIHPYFHELTMDIIMRVAMGQKGSKLFNNPYVEMVKNVFLHFGGSKFNTLAAIAPGISWVLRNIFLAYAFIAKVPFAVMLTELKETVRERKKLKASGELQSNSEHVDFIDLFMDAEDPTVKDGEFEKTGIKVSKKMTEAEIISNCFVFLLAGFDTTANTLAVTCHFLAKHPEIQEKLFEEIQDVIADEKMTFEKINDLRYMDAVMKEALRMFPIAAFAAARECMHTTTLGDYKIEAGENVNVCYNDGDGFYRNAGGEESEQKLISVAEKIQAQLLMSIERLISLTEQIDGRSDLPREQLQYYQEKIWPILMETDQEITWLSEAVREGINSCTIDEKRLSILLALNKFHLRIQTVATFLSVDFNDEIESLLELRERGIRGLTLKAESLSFLRREHMNLRTKLLSI
ncbi:hypothetical protein FO519_009091 [Halicephalobus sp. NKZ332]|nr:hypothetical protein FO519_009091 [Halicephalobus sp. NKZ332]